MVRETPADPYPHDSGVTLTATELITPQTRHPTTTDVVRTAWTNLEAGHKLETDRRNHWTPLHLSKIVKMLHTRHTCLASALELARNLPRKKNLAWGTLVQGTEPRQQVAKTDSARLASLMLLDKALCVLNISSFECWCFIDDCLRVVHTKS